jgi:hypothetical protein
VALPKTTYFMPNQPIPVTTAQQMIYAYKQYMIDHGVDMNQQTQSVGFASSTLLAWLTDVSPLMDELRIFYGLYQSGTSNGRTTVILWPYKNGQPAMRAEEQARSSDEAGRYVEPFNEGDLRP